MAEIKYLDLTTLGYYDTTLKAFIDETYTKPADIPTDVSAFTNDAGYQTATEVSSAIDDALDTFSNASIQIVDELPDTGDAGVIYLVPIADSSNYEKWAYENGAWHDLGEMAIDLSDYFKAEDFVPITEDEIDAMF